MRIEGARAAYPQPLASADGAVQATQTRQMPKAAWANVADGNTAPTPKHLPQGAVEAQCCGGGRGGEIARWMRPILELLKWLIGSLLGRQVRERGAPTQHTDDARPVGAGRGGGAPGAAVGAGQKIDGPNGFLWKPVSDSDGKLAILTPKELTGQVQSVTVRDAGGQVIEQGRRSGVGNGDREHFRFGRPGAQFPPNSVVEVQLKDGTIKRYRIANPAARND